NPALGFAWEYGGMSVDHTSHLGHGHSFAVGNCSVVRPGQRYWATRGLWRGAITLAVSGCSHSPTMDLLGSYFPAWMLCAAAGIVAAVIIRQIVAMAAIHHYVLSPLLPSTSFSLSTTLLLLPF